MKNYHQQTTWASLGVAAALLALAPSSVSASKLVYSPNSPSFGGNPFMADFLIGTAERQNQFTEDSGGGGDFPDINFPDIIITNPEPPTPDEPPTGPIQTVPQ